MEIVSLSQGIWQLPLHNENVIRPKDQIFLDAVKKIMKDGSIYILDTSHLLSRGIEFKNLKDWGVTLVMSNAVLCLMGTPRRSAGAVIIP